MKEGHIKRIDNGDVIYDEYGNYFYKYSENQYRKYIYGAGDEEDDEERYTREELLELPDKIVSYDYEQVQRVLRDLSARQCYGVMLKRTDCDCIYGRLYCVHPKDKKPTIYIDRYDYVSAPYRVEDWKPVLKSPDKLTGDERADYLGFMYHFSANNLPNYEGYFVDEYLVGDFVAWCYEHHVDINDLISLGLAEELTEDNNPYKDCNN